MGDLFGGNFNSGDFYGMGAEDAPWYDISQYAAKLPDFSSWANTAINPVAKLDPAAVKAPVVDVGFDTNAWAAQLSKDFEKAQARDEARNAASPVQQSIDLPVIVNRNAGPTVTKTGTPSSSSSGNFSQNVASVATAITSFLAPIVAARQQRSQTAAQRRQRAPGGSIVRGGSDNTTTYLYIGGGALLLAGLVFLVAKD